MACNVCYSTQIQVHAGVFHGDEALCTSGNTRAIQVQDGEATSIWHWNENIEFEIEVRDLPRGARLCLGIYAIYGGKGKGKKRREVRTTYPNTRPVFRYEILMQVPQWAGPIPMGRRGGPRLSAMYGAWGQCPDYFLGP